MNNVGRPLLGTSAYDKGSGVCATSPPRMLKVQATAWLSDKTSASAPSLVISASIRFSLSASASPANGWPCGATGGSGRGGRSVQTASTGLTSTATSSAPALAQ